MTHAITECGECGNTFSYDDSIFSTRPKAGGGMFGLGMLCSACANNKFNQKRHEESSRAAADRASSEERRHQELVSALRTSSAKHEAPIASRAYDGDGNPLPFDILRAREASLATLASVTKELSDSERNFYMSSSQSRLRAIAPDEAQRQLDVFRTQAAAKVRKQLDKKMLRERNLIKGQTLPFRLRWVVLVMFLVALWYFAG